MTPKLNELVTELREADAEDRKELYLDLARDLPPLPDRFAGLRDEAHRVPECDSPVFLFAEADGRRIRLFADAPVEAPTVRGFVALLLLGLDGATLDEILSVPDDLIVRAGIHEVLGGLHTKRARNLAYMLRRLKAAAVRSAPGALQGTPDPPRPQGTPR